MVYCQDVAIISCEELIENRKGICKKLVIEYMPEYKCPIPNHWLPPFTKHSCRKFDTKIKLYQFFNQKQLESIYQRILGRIDKRPSPCFSLIFK